MMMASSIIQRCRNYSLIHNYYSLVNKSYAKCQTAALSSFERRRMQSVFDTTSWWSQKQRRLPSQVSPWLMLTPELTFDDKEDTVSKVVYKFYDVRSNQVTSFEGDSGAHLQLHNRAGDAFKGSSHGWLAEFDSSTRDLFLYNPISRRRLKLPTMDTLPLRGSPRQGPIDLNDTTGKSDCIVKKVILSSSDPDEDEGCVAMMLYGADNRLASCHPAARGGQWYPLGSRHWEWDDDEKRRARSYQDVAYSAREKLFFSITKEGDELEAWDSTALLAYDMPISIKDYFKEEEDKYTSIRRCEREFYLKGLSSGHRERYLVVAEPYHHRGGSPPSQQLFLVLRHKIRLSGGSYWPEKVGWEKCNYDKPLQTVAFDVRRFDVEKRELVHMDRTLDGWALFVGKNHSFAVKAGDFDGLKPNSIYFTDSEPQDDPDVNKYGGHDNGVYNYEDGTFSSCYYPCEDDSYERMVPAPMWFSPIDHKIGS